MTWDQEEPGYEIDEREARRQRSLALIAEVEAATADLPERRARSLRGEDVPQWRVPEPEPSLVKAEVAAQVKAEGERLSAQIRSEYRAHVKSREESFAEIIGEQTGLFEKAVREHFEEKITALEVRITHLQNQIAELKTREDVIPRFLGGTNGDARLQ